ncbi:MAG TPA: enoyl-CoA hydratase/isomerase family protein [Steroidobacteraceae bacterium]|jgi:enoyl-CoA hydratase/carnithine racemase|nr:enoyl-CoA hydratase/isomerase family protein [Steroidobacteraceae bacterium]
MDVLSEVRNHVALVTLNRPAALNALSLEMVLRLRGLLEEHALDPDVFAVLISGAGGRAFCAGGDIRALYQNFKATGSLQQEFFAAEYPLDYLLYFYPKPHAVLMDGITLGGGMGIAQSSRLRIVGERTSLGMPEVAIGFFPDVGAGYFLSRLPGMLGIYLGLTGVQIRAADALYCRLADACLPAAASAVLIEELAQLRWSDDPALDLHRFVHAHAAPALPPPLAQLREAIDTHFAHSSVAAILSSLSGERRPQYAGWALQTAELMRSRSPTMLGVTLRQLQRGAALSLADCLRMELGMALHAFEQGDFIEGVRATLVEKDNSPRWQPARIEAVTEEMIDAFFHERWTAGRHPLADLESQAAASVSAADARS